MKKRRALPFQVIVLAQGKGGAGKSALTTGLAGLYYREGYSVGMIDADPQGTIAKLHDVDGPMGQIAVLEAPDAETISAAIEDGRSKFDVVLVDTAGFQNQTTILALVAADFVLIPTRAARDNVSEAILMYQQTLKVSQLPDRQGRPLLASMVLTQIKSKTVIARTTRKALRKHGFPVLSAQMADRIIYAESAGISPCMIDPRGNASRDLGAIAREMERIGHEQQIVAA